MIKRCEYCGAAFEIKGRDRRRMAQRYCSRSCATLGPQMARQEAKMRERETGDGKETYHEKVSRMYYEMEKSLRETVRTRRIQREKFIAGLGEDKAMRKTEYRDGKKITYRGTCPVAAWR